MTYRSLESIIRDTNRQRSEYKSVSSAIRSIYEKYVETHSSDQIVVGGYRTKHFEQCPKAQKLYSNLPEDIDRNRAEIAAKFLDQLFALEKGIMSTEKATSEDIEQAERYAERAKDQARMLNMEKEHEFIDDHVKVIKSFHKMPSGPKEVVTDDDIKKVFTRPPVDDTPERRDVDIDNQKFRISRNIKAQRKLKIIDND